MQQPAYQAWASGGKVLSLSERLQLYYWRPTGLAKKLRYETSSDVYLELVDDGKVIC